MLLPLDNNLYISVIKHLLLGDQDKNSGPCTYSRQTFIFYELSITNSDIAGSY